MVKYTSRVKSGLKPLQNPTKKDMASKVLERSPSDSKKKSPPVSPQKKKGGAINVGGEHRKASKIRPALSDETIDQMTHVPFIHMLGMMDMPTFYMLQGIASNYLRSEHPMRLITKSVLGGDFSFPKHLSKIAMRDVMKAQSPQQLSHALHSEWIDKLKGNLSTSELGGGLFASLKTLVKKGIAGGKKALSSLARGAAGAVRAVSAGAKGAQMIGKSVSSALEQGLQVANSLAPVIKQVFPQTEGILKAGLGHANAAKELLARGIDISSQVEQAIKPAIDILGPLDAPIAFPFEQESKTPLAGEPLGAGLDSTQVDPEDRINEESGPRFVS